MNQVTRYWGLLVGIGIFILTMVIFVMFAAAGWPGAPDGCLSVVDGIARDNCYCETIGTSWIKQPVNTLSDLAFVVAGMSMLVVVGTENHGGGGSNALVAGSWMASLYGWVIILMGPGSMYFHAGFTHWGGFLDSTSMFLLLTFIIGYDLHQATTREIWVWLSWCIAVAMLILALILVAFFPKAATGIFAGFAVSTGVFDLVIRRVFKLQRSGWWYGGFFLVFGTAATIWILSHTSKPWCVPDAVLLQGHAWWHILSALAMVLLFMYFRSETGGRTAD